MISKKPAVTGGLRFSTRSQKPMEDTMKKFFSCAAAVLLVAGLTAGSADAKSRKGTNMTKGAASSGNSANSASGKNSPASSAKGSASSAGGGEK